MLKRNVDYYCRKARKYAYPCVDHFRYAIARKRAVYFLHISKTGGTAIKEAFGKDVSLSKFHLSFGDHSLKLCDVPQDSKAIFFLRDPVDRFVSSFYSRQRKGRPRYDHEWTEDEARAFATFSTPDALATALSSSDTTERSTALCAMRKIQHIRHDYATWLGPLDYLRRREQSILYIGFQETLSKDFETIKILIGAPESLALPSGPIEAHRRPVEQSCTLSITAVINIKSYFAKDYEILRYCRSLSGWRLSAK